MAVDHEMMATAQQQGHVSSGQPTTENFWALVLKRNSHGKLTRLLSHWMRDSIRPVDEAHGQAAPDPQLRTGISGGDIGGLSMDVAKVGPMSREHSAPLDTEYEYHKQDAEGTPRTDSPDDVMSTLSMMRSNSRPSAGSMASSSVHDPASGTGSTPPDAPSDPASANDSEPSTSLDVPETATTSDTLSGELDVRIAPPPSQQPVVSAATPAAPNAVVAQSDPVQPALEHSRSRDESVAPSPSKIRVNSCHECQAEFSGPSFMLNDRAYCCQRHRLLAYHKFERSQMNSPGLITSDDLDCFSPTGVRATFKAWI